MVGCSPQAVVEAPPGAFAWEAQNSIEPGSSADAGAFSRKTQTFGFVDEPEKPNTFADKVALCFTKAS